MSKITAEQLQVGDTIEVWWPPGRDTITALRPYDGPLACLECARLASFALWRCGMTMEEGAVFERIEIEKGTA